MIGWPMKRLSRPKNRMDRLAFAGPMCVGKTTLADGLAGLYDGYTKIAFADTLKGLAYSLYGVQGKDNESRKLLQELADDLKKWDYAVFIKSLLTKAELLIKDGHEKLVVDDVRFREEAEALQKNGFVLFRVTCEENVRRNRIKTLYPDMDSSRMNHPSEHGWKSMKFDYNIDSTYEIAHFDLDGIIQNGNSNRFYRKG